MLTEFNLFDAVGKLVMKSLLNVNTHTVYLGNLKQGLYVAQIQNDAGSVFNEKFVI
jgi:hypothetical protein